MKNKQQKTRARLQPLQSGQIWQMEGANLEIGLIGKTLVHYKHYKGQMKRSPVSLLNRTALERFLQDNQAVLIQRPDPGFQQRENGTRSGRTKTAA
jgi:hypothetical protein